MYVLNTNNRQTPPAPITNQGRNPSSTQNAASHISTLQTNQTTTDAQFIKKQERILLKAQEFLVEQENLPSLGVGFNQNIEKLKNLVLNHKTLIDQFNSSKESLSQIQRTLKIKSDLEKNHSEIGSKLWSLSQERNPNDTRFEEFSQQPKSTSSTKPCPKLTPSTQTIIPLKPGNLPSSIEPVISTESIDIQDSDGSPATTTTWGDWTVEMIKSIPLKKIAIATVSVGAAALTYYILANNKPCLEDDFTAEDLSPFLSQNVSNTSVTETDLEIIENTTDTSLMSHLWNQLVPYFNFSLPTGFSFSIVGDELMTEESPYCNDSECFESEEDLFLAEYCPLEETLPSTTLDSIINLTGLVETAKTVQQLSTSALESFLNGSLFKTLCITVLPPLFLEIIAVTKTDQIAKENIDSNKKSENKETPPTPTPAQENKKQIYDKDIILENLAWTGKKQSVFYVDKDKQGNTVVVQQGDLVEPASAAIVEEKETFASFDELCEHIVKERIGVSAFNTLSQKEQESLKKQASYSARNRPDLEAKMQQLSKNIRTLLGENVDPIIKTTHSYSHNSPFNGYVYETYEGDPLINTDEKSACGKPIVRLTSATASSQDRGSTKTQNLSVIECSDKEKTKIYTGRVETEEKALEQALFMFSKEAGVSYDEATADAQARTNLPESLQNKRGITFENGSIVFTYVVHSTMSDSTSLDLTAEAAAKEKTFLKKEYAALQALKNRTKPIKIDGETYNVQFKPILFSQSFNAYTQARGPFMEGDLSPVISLKSWKELKPSLTSNKEVQLHIDALDRHFTSLNPFTQLDNLTLFLHLQHVMQESGIPTAIHCKSSTDRTGIGVAYTTALVQYKALGKTVPKSMNDLLKEEAFKELFAIAWQPWHQRSRHSRDVLGISFGGYPVENPMVLRGLPDRYKQNNYIACVGLNILYIPIMLGLDLAFGAIYQTVSFAYALGSAAWHFRDNDKTPLQDFATAFRNTVKIRCNNPISYIPLQSVRKDAFLSERHLLTKGSCTSPLEKEKPHRVDLNWD